MLSESQFVVLGLLRYIAYGAVSILLGWALYQIALFLYNDL